MDIMVWIMTGFVWMIISRVIKNFAICQLCDGLLCDITLPTVLVIKSFSVCVVKIILTRLKCHAGG